jgi:hypothetical protein
MMMMVMMVTIAVMMKVGFNIRNALVAAATGGPLLALSVTHHRRQHHATFTVVHGTRCWQKQL